MQKDVGARSNAEVEGKRVVYEGLALEDKCVEGARTPTETWKKEWGTLNTANSARWTAPAPVARLHV